MSFFSMVLIDVLYHEQTAACKKSILLSIKQDAIDVPLLIDRGKYEQ